MALCKAKVDDMMDFVRRFRLAERVPINYAIKRLMRVVRFVSEYCNWKQWSQRQILDNLSEDLQIEKGGGQKTYMCIKKRVDAMDFKLWFSHYDLDINI